MKERAGQRAHEARCASGGNHLSNYAAGKYYHFHRHESQYALFTRFDEKLSLPGEHDLKQVRRFDEGMMPTGAHRQGFERRPEVWHEPRGDDMQTHVLPMPR